MRKRIMVISACLLVLVCILSACEPVAEFAIIGTWKSQKTVLGVVTETVYVFNEDGTGSRKTVWETEFTYSLTDEKLLITTSTLGIETTEEYTYDFDGKKLMLTGEHDTIYLERVE